METKRVRLTGRLQKQGRIRHPDFKKYSVKEVLSRLTDPKNPHPVDFNGTPVYMSKSKYRVFEKSHICAKCGLEAQYFILEKHGLWANKGNVFSISKDYRFHLMAIKEDGNVVEFTQDHILPKALGGINDLINYQTMCSNCNRSKGHKVEEADIGTMGKLLEELKGRSIPTNILPFQIKLQEVVNEYLIKKYRR